MNNASAIQYKICGNNNYYTTLIHAEGF